MPERRSAVTWTKMSLPPSFATTKPKPRAGSYHFTTPSRDSAGPRLSPPPRSRGCDREGWAVEVSMLSTATAALPLAPCAQSKVTVAPSGACVKPERSSTAKGKKTSPPPSDATMKPNPLLRLNHLMVPVRRVLSPGGRSPSGGRKLLMDSPATLRPPPGRLARHPPGGVLPAGATIFLTGEMPLGQGRTHALSASPMAMRSVHRTRRVDQIVNTGVMTEAPFTGEQIVNEAADLPHLQALVAQARGEFRGPNEPVPSMRTAWKPAEHVLGADDPEEEAFGCAVERGADERPAWPKQRRACLQKGVDVRDMLDHLERQHRVEAFAGGSQILGTRLSIIDLEIGAASVGAGHADIRFGGVDAGHGRAEPREWLRDQSAAAADIENAQAIEGAEALHVASEVRRQRLTQEAEARGIEPVQRGHRAPRI